MKKALVPLLLILAAVVLLLAAVRWYETKFGSEGPFEPQHHH